MLFGPDGFLYLGIGDGGNDDAASGVAGNGQTTTNVLGKMLRHRRERYRSRRCATASRPTTHSPAIRRARSDGMGTQDCPEIFAWGFRNPWRWSFDRVGGQLWLGDVGSHDREEVDRVVQGRQLRLALHGRHARDDA